eukprot:Opistho-1_new@12631
MELFRCMWAVRDMAFWRSMLELRRDLSVAASIGNKDCKKGYFAYLAEAAVSYDTFAVDRDFDVVLVRRPIELSLWARAGRRDVLFKVPSRTGGSAHDSRRDPATERWLEEALAEGKFVVE